MTLHNVSSTRAMSEPGPGRKPVLALLLRVLFGAAFVLQVCGAQAAAVLTTFHSFHVFASGAYPHAELVQGIDGNFYGTTSGGGTNDAGTVFRISTNGTLTTLYSFTGGSDGANPIAGLVEGGYGTFYGTTSGGCTNGGQGTVFKISTNGALTSLYSFTGTNDGANPQAGLILVDNTLCGTANTGGSSGNGTVFSLSFPPQLTIIPSGANMVLTWPTNYLSFDYTGYTLQSSTNMTSLTAWKPASPSPVVIGGQKVVVSPMSVTQQFYRLRQ
jgi:uncharacterized repeat protein (TIGR03803 family)